MTDTTITNVDWLTAIDKHPDTTNADLLAGYHHLGVVTDRTPEQLNESTFRLQVLGFLEVAEISDDGRTYHYRPRIPETVAA